MNLGKGWAEAAGKAAAARDRAERGARASGLKSDRQHLLDARREYEADMGRKTEGYGMRPQLVAADQWLKDARASSAAAGAEFAGLFDKGEE